MLSNSELLAFLAEVDAELERPIRITAVGGTAMTLLNLKPSTIDVDFELNSRDAAVFKAALARVPHGFKLDLFENGLIFSQALPEDFAEKCIPIKTKLHKVKLFALHPLDVVATKIGRLDGRDIQDIGECIKKFKLSKRQVESRCKQVEYVGKMENFKANIKHVLEKFF